MNLLNPKYELLWKLLDKYKFELVDPNINDIFCIICKQILRNPIANICGCKYCNDCITSYLDGGRMFCPGTFEECKEHMINKKNDLQVDFSVNKLLMTLLVKCPIEGCESSGQLKFIKEHIKTHELRVQFDEFTQAQSLVDKIREMKYDIYSIKEDSKSQKEVLSSIENEVSRLSNYRLHHRTGDIYADEGAYEPNKHILESYTKKYDAINAQRRQMMAQQKSLFQKLIRLDTERKMRKQRDKEIELQIELAKDKSDKLENYCMSYESKVTRITNSFMSKPVHYEETYRKPTRLRRTSIELDENRQDLVVKNPVRRIVSARRLQWPMENMLISINNPLATSRFLSPPDRVAPFQWRLDNFQDRLTDARRDSQMTCISDVFCTHRHGYSIQLQAHPNGYLHGRDTHLSLFVRLVKGQHDLTVPWPMSCLITIGIVNQAAVTSGAPVYCCKKQFVYESSDVQSSCAIGDDRFLSLREVVATCGLMVGGTIVVECSVELQ